MALLEFVRGPEDIRRLERDQLQPLADEVRRRLIDVVSQTGGHIGAGRATSSNLSPTRCAAG